MAPVFLCGFWPYAVAEAADILVARHPGLRLVHDTALLSRSADSVGDRVGDVLITVPEAFEPDQIRAAWRERHADGAPRVITVVPAEYVLDGLTDETALRALDLHQDPADERRIGDVVARQLEQADTVLLAGQPDDDWEAEQLRVLLHRIAPWSQHRALPDAALPDAGRRTPVRPLTRGLRGYAVGVHEPVPDHGVVACTFVARRPFHPERLHDALDEVTDRVLRSRGHFWLAGRPDLVMTWEGAGGLDLGPVTGWLADLPGEHWAGVDPERCLAADIDWDPYYGDRSQHLAFVGVDLDPVRLHRALAHCLLTDAELAQGHDAWRDLADPFRRAYPACAVTAHTTEESHW